MDMDPIINGGIAFAAVLILMVLNIPIGIAMLLVGFTGFALISGFDPAIFVLGTAPFDAVSKYTLSVLPLFVLMGNEIDYSFNEARKILNLGASDARAFMIRNNEWKYIYYKGFEPQLFDLKNDPDEFNDLGRSKDHSKIREEMKELLLKRIIDRKNRVAATDEFVTKERDYTKDDGIMIGVW